MKQNSKKSSSNDAINSNESNTDETIFILELVKLDKENSDSANEIIMRNHIHWLSQYILSDDIV